MATCNFSECDRPVFSNMNECALHIEKNDYSQDFRSTLLAEFYKQLRDYVADYFWRYNSLDKNQALGLLDREQPQPQIKNKTVVFKKIKFPTHDSRDVFDYEKVLSKLGAIHYDSCVFYTTDLDLGEVKLFYQDCVFIEEWSFRNNPLLENFHNYQYQLCVFHKNVSNDYTEPTNDNNLFYLCNFKGKVSLSNITFKGSLLNYTYTDKYYDIPRIEIHNCVFDNKIFDPNSENVFSIKELVIEKSRFVKDFILSNNKMDLLNCQNSSFGDRFYFQNNELKKIAIEQVSFNQATYFSNTFFGEYSIKNSTFEQVVYMNECEFGVDKLLGDPTKPAEFVNVNFLSFLDFRKAKFHSGLNISDVNLNEPPNFLSVEINDANTNRESFRLIKNSFDRIQNYIEANEFYIKEMKKYREELKKGKVKNQWRFLLFFYEKFSNYGSDYVKPIIWLLGLAAVYTLVIFGYEENWLYPSWSPLNSFFNSLFSLINTIAKNVIPFSRLVYEGIEALSLFFYIIFASLIWLIILAIKRNTKR